MLWTLLGKLEGKSNINYIKCLFTFQKRFDNYIKHLCTHFKTFWCLFMMKLCLLRFGPTNVRKSSYDHEINSWSKTCWYFKIKVNFFSTRPYKYVCIQSFIENNGALLAMQYAMHWYKCFFSNQIKFCLLT